MILALELQEQEWVNGRNYGHRGVQNETLKQPQQTAYKRNYIMYIFICLRYTIKKGDEENFWWKLNWVSEHEK